MRGGGIDGSGLRRQCLSKRDAIPSVLSLPFNLLVPVRPPPPSFPLSSPLVLVFSLFTLDNLSTANTMGLVSLLVPTA